MTYPIEPEAVVQLVDAYVTKAHKDAAKFSNSSPLDESGAYSLHALAAEVYALAWDHATRAAEARRTNIHQRALDTPSERN